MVKVLVVEDEASIREMIALNLRLAGMEAVEADSAEAALPLLEQRPGCDAAILDVMLPGMNGFSLCETIRRTDQKIGIIILSAKGQEQDKIRGLSIGADDYMTKPFSLREVAARVKAVLRRTQQGEGERAPEQIVYESLVLDIIKKKVSIDGEEAPLTKKEFEILLLLLQNKGRVFSREDILGRIWSDEVYVLDRTIDVNITRLRKKIGIYGKCIVTRLGYGYCFEAQ